MAGHESFDRPDEVTMGSERSFGIVFAVVFALVGGWQLWAGRGWGYWVLGASGCFLALAYLAPRLLAPFNRLWFRLGLLLHRIINPIVLGILFYGVVMPTGALMRLFGKRPLNLAFDASAPSYWIRRAGPAHPADSFTKQF